MPAAATKIDLRPYAGHWEHLTYPGWPQDKTPVWRRFELKVPVDPNTPLGPPGVMLEWHEDGRLKGYLFYEFVEEWIQHPVFDKPGAARRVKAVER